MSEENKPVRVPLVEHLARIPADARYVYTEDTGLRATHYIPIGRIAAEVADRIAQLGAALDKAHTAINLACTQVLECTEYQGHSCAFYHRNQPEKWCDACRLSDALESAEEAVSEALNSGGEA